MSTIERYVVCDDPDEWGDGPVYDSYEEAKQAAHEQDACVVTLEYEYSDSSLTDDFRGEDEEGMQRFIDENRAAIDEAILRALDRTADEFPLDDDERRQWIANDEGLYDWARSEGVRV